MKRNICFVLSLPLWGLIFLVVFFEELFEGPDEDAGWEKELKAKNSSYSQEERQEERQG